MADRFRIRGVELLFRLLLLLLLLLAVELSLKVLVQLTVLVEAMTLVSLLGRMFAAVETLLLLMLSCCCCVLFGEAGEVFREVIDPSSQRLWQ